MPAVQRAGSAKVIQCTHFQEKKNREQNTLKYTKIQFRRNTCMTHSETYLEVREEERNS